MDANTPAREIRSADLAKNTAAFLECYQAVRRRKILRAVDIRYGLGGWASALCDANKNVKVLGFEADQETFDGARFFEGHTHVWHDHFPPRKLGAIADLDAAKPVDLLCADFNNLTMMKAEPLLEAIRLTNPRMVIFTDVACSKMHLNFNSYGLTEPNLFAYFERFNEVILPNWTHVHTARHHHHAATTAWIR